MTRDVSNGRWRLGASILDGEASSPGQVLDDLRMSDGDLGGLIAAAQLAVTHVRELRVNADSQRASPGTAECEETSASPAMRAEPVQDRYEFPYWLVTGHP